MKSTKSHVNFTDEVRSACATKVDIELRTEQLEHKPACCERESSKHPPVPCNHGHQALPGAYIMTPIYPVPLKVSHYEVLAYVCFTTVPSPSLRPSSRLLYQPPAGYLSTSSTWSYIFLDNGVTDRPAALLFPFSETTTVSPLFRLKPRAAAATVQLILGCGSL